MNHGNTSHRKVHCPRCDKKVHAKNGRCPSCGEPMPRKKKPIRASGVRGHRPKRQ